MKLFDEKTMKNDTRIKYDILHSSFIHWLSSSFIAKKNVFLQFNFVIMLFGSKNNKLTSNTTKISNYVRWPWLKDLLMTFIATTFSIVLTFGTAALIDRKQKEKSKRQMVMYVLYDMNRSIELVEHVDSMLREGLELQIEVARDTSLFEQKRFFFNHCMPNEHFDNTTAQIFSSNFETLNTLDNVRFVEMISTFYHDRDDYETIVIDSCRNEFLQKFYLSDLQTTLEFPYSTYILISGTIWDALKENFQKCKALMGVSDEELAAFELKERGKSEPKASVGDTDNKHLKEMVENDMRLEAAIEEGKSGKTQSE